MKGLSKVKNSSLYLILLSGLILISCKHFPDSTEIIKYYENPEIAAYQVKKIALLPILPDDSTNYGAYFSTNHFYNILDEQYPSLILADIDWVREFDCSFIDYQIGMIRSTSQFDLETFYKSEIGYDLIEDDYDAVIIGTIDSLANSSGIFMRAYNNYAPVLGWQTFCRFTYYIVSLKDGRILWKAIVNGDEIFQMENFYIKEFPPLDYAITDGIDRMIAALPKEVFNNNINDQSERN